jgi:hypothetical protein
MDVIPWFVLSRIQVENALKGRLTEVVHVNGVSIEAGLVAAVCGAERGAGFSCTVRERREVIICASVLEMLLPRPITELAWPRTPIAIGIGGKGNFEMREQDNENSNAGFVLP